MRRNSACLVKSLMTMLCMLSHVSTAVAHGFGQRYDLPIPLWLYAMEARARWRRFALLAIGVFAGHLPCTALVSPPQPPRQASGAVARPPACTPALAAWVRRPVCLTHLDRPVWLPASRAESGANAGVDHLVGGMRIRLSSAGEPLGAAQSLEDTLWVGRNALSLLCTRSHTGP